MGEWNTVPALQEFLGGLRSFYPWVGLLDSIGDPKAKWLKWFEPHRETGSTTSLRGFKRRNVAISQKFLMKFEK